MSTNDTNSTFDANGYWTPPKPKWNDWDRTWKCPLWEAVSLACDVDPATYRPCGLTVDASLDGVPTFVPEKVRVLLDLAKSAVASKALKISPIVDLNLMKSEVDLADFTTWLNALKFKTPDGYFWTSQAFESEPNIWPWGKHETKMLQSLARAANKFWKNYDPDDISTAPKNEEVIAWLKTDGVSENLAKTIASLLRPDGLRTGRR